MMVQYSVRRTSEAALIHLSISRSILLPLENKTPIYLNSSIWGRNSPPFSDRAPWSQTWRCSFSSQLLHSRPQTCPVHVKGHCLMKPAEPYHLQKAEMLYAVC
ncbi:hypothetical protein LDENG_00231760 [Lucifuga dentata]|nr:hypothetical protein LDENG_00231760 [Lucifuga dentata]